MEPEKFTSEIHDEDRTTDKNSGEMFNLDEIKNVVAKKLHTVAGDLSEKAGSPELQPVIGDYGKQAADWLDQSAQYIQDFDHQEFNARMRTYIRENPGTSILIAGATGLILGALVRRM